MNPDVPECEGVSLGGEDNVATSPPTDGQHTEAASSPEYLVPPFPSRREVHQESLRRHSLFPSALGMEKAREMAADIFDESPNPLNVATTQARSVPWWKWSAAGVLVVAAVVSVPLGGWETTLSAADTVQSSQMGEAHAVGPFSVTVGKAGWFKDIRSFGYTDPQKSYLVMRVTVSDFSAKSALAPSVIGDVLNVYLEGQTPTAVEEAPASGSFNDTVKNVFGNEPTRGGLTFVGAMRATDEQEVTALQPGFTQDVFGMWVLPEGAEMTSTVTVRINSLKERRSTLNDLKVWADPKSLSYTELAVLPVEGQ